MSNVDATLMPPGCENGITYRRLAEHLKSMILDGKLPSGTRLPPVRRLALNLQTSNLTVYRAYAALAESGFTEGTTGRGTFVSERPTRSAGIEMLANLSKTGPFNGFEFVSETSGLRSLATAFPDPALFDASELLAEFADLRKSTKWLWSLTSPSGTPELIVQINRILRSRGIEANDNEIVVTNGETHGLSLLANVLGAPGGTFLLEDPRGLMLREAIEGQHVRVVPFSYGHEGVDLAEIERLAEKHRPAALVITSSFSNPTGASLSAEIGSELVAVGRRYGFKIIEIDSYRGLNYGSPLSPTLSERYPADVVYVDTFSYCLVPGLRAGYIRCAGELQSKLAKGIQISTISPPQVMQMALAGYLSNGGLQRHLARVVPRYKARRDALAAALSLFMPKARYSVPEGGFSTWIELPSGSTTKLYQESIARGVAFAPGYLLTSSPSADRYLRLAFGMLEPDAIKEAVRTIGTLVNER